MVRQTQQTRACELVSPVWLSGAWSGVARAEGVYRELERCRVRLWRGLDSRVRLYSGESSELSGRCSYSMGVGREGTSLLLCARAVGAQDACWVVSAQTRPS